MQELEQEKIEGYVEHIVYRNEENGYTVLNISTNDDEITCVGIFRDVNEGEYLEASGFYQLHASYGQQFRMQDYRVKIPDSGAAFERYLGSGAIKGIGQALAARIIKHFGDDARRILQEEPERLAEVKGISSRMAARISENIMEKSQMQNALIFLSQYGITLNLGVKIYNTYQDSLYQVLRENPYRLAEDIDGVGFRIADQIAAKVGIRPDSEFRIRSALFYTMNQAGLDGHTYLLKEELLQRCQELLELDPELLEDKYLVDLTIEKKLFLKESILPDGRKEVHVYTAQMYFVELNTARMLQELNVRCLTNEKEIRRQLEMLEKKDGILLDELQQQAIFQAVRSGIMILTGGPGTGKTTTINAMIRYFIAEGMDIALAAPTGRAAKRMTEATGYQASTIHRLLEVNGGSGDNDSSANTQFGRNAENPLEADVIIIDEVSMVDIYLMHALLSAIIPGTRLILVGDMNQLPSVGPGSVLKDMIRTEKFPLVRLHKIFRQAAQSDIVVNAHKINRGEQVVLGNKSKDFMFLERDDARVIQRGILRLVQEKLPRYVDAAPFDIQVLCPMRKGALGVENLNAILQRYMNPPSAEKEEKETAAGLFREGDKVMQIKNNYQMEWQIKGAYGIVGQQGTGIFNGDMGIVKSIDHQAERVIVEYEEGKLAEYDFRQLDELELAYAVTIHKSQGSEYPAVVIPLLSGPRMLMTRNLLYTAVTRARQCVILLGSRLTFEQMVANRMEEKRHTSLDERILELYEEALEGDTFDFSESDLSEPLSFV